MLRQPVHIVRSYRRLTVMSGDEESSESGLELDEFGKARFKGFDGVGHSVFRPLAS